MRRALGTIFAATLALALASGARADGWASFYEPTQPRAAAPRSGGSPSADTGICIREILDAQTRHGIPDNLLLAIGLQEAGTRRNGQYTVWPYAVNAAGTGRLFDSRTAALDWVRERQRDGVRSIDVGCMQINLRWHPEAFTDAAQGFDPRANVDYAARFLKDLRQRTGSWMQAAGAYHSQEPEYRDIYLTRLRGNISAANARLADFVALANATGSHQLKAPARNNDVPDRGVVVARATWGARLGGDTNARSSIYSTQDIQPILPVFFSHTGKPTG